MTRQAKRPGAMARISLKDFVKARSIEAARAAMAEGGERIAYRIGENLNSDLNKPEALIRIKAASPQEREAATAYLIQIGNALAANDALPPNPERIVFAADRAGFGMNTTPRAPRSPADRGLRDRNQRARTPPWRSPLATPTRRLRASWPRGSARATAHPRCWPRSRSAWRSCGA